MSKAFTKESDAEGDEHDHAAEEAAHAQLVGVKNYITPSGLQRLRDELRFLLTRERPAVTQVVSWVAGNGDRSENADYQYGKRKLRQIDRRIRFLTKRIDAAEVVDPAAPRQGRAATQVFFGATVRYTNSAGAERVVSIVGADEVDLVIGVETLQGGFHVFRAVWATCRASVDGHLGDRRGGMCLKDEERQQCAGDTV